jgi:hypothetical protein
MLLLVRHTVKHKPEIQELMRYMEGQSPSIGGGLADVG